MDPGFIATGGRKVPYFCSYCKRDITLSLRIRCVECSTEETPFELCGDCFAVGINVSNHVNSHTYRVVDCLDTPIFVNDWTANEELLLLEGIVKFGVGNWRTIAEYINTNKSAGQVESHYWELYMGRFGYCLPEFTIVKGKQVPTETLLEQDESNGVSNARNMMRTALLQGHELGEEVVRDKGKDLSVIKEKTGGSREKAVEAQIREKIAQMPGADLPGYMPLRGDFDYEYDNDAEALLADMEFEADDHPSERELKLQVIRIYNQKLDTRDSRKRFVIERGIVDFKQQQGVSLRIYFVSIGLVHY